MSTEPTTYHRAARAYVAKGWRVAPLAPGQKFPAIAKWQKVATTDPAMVDAWWGPDGAYRGHGVCIVTGERSGRLVVVDIDVSDDKRGDDTWATLTEGKDVPPTATSITGTGGMHLLYSWPEGVPVPANSAGSKLGPGIDVRGEGGQIVAPPSLHPNGTAYEWDAGEPEEPAEAPPWLVEALSTPEAPPEPTEGPTPPLRLVSDDEDSPAAWFNEQTTWHDLLGRDGWTLTNVTSSGEQQWTRPGKEAKDGISATVGHEGRDVLKVFTSSVEGLDAEGSYGRFGYEAAVKYGGDRAALASAIRRVMPHPDDDLPTIDPEGVARLIADPAGIAEDVEHGWEPVDLDAIMDEGYERPVPTVGIVGEGPGALFYCERVNAIIGESGGGKSWVTQWCIAESLKAEVGVLVVDLEDHVGSYVDRLKRLGVSPALIRSHLVYVAPENGWNARAAKALRELVSERGVGLVVIDSTGEALALDGTNPNEDDGVATWFRKVPRYLAGLGPAVVLTDHVPKSEDAAKGFAIGSQRKRAAIDGASYRVEVDIPPAKNVRGQMHLVAAKDRNGFYQHGSRVATITIEDASAGVVHMEMKVPTEEEQKGKDPYAVPGRVMQFVKEWEGDKPPSSAAIEKGVRGSASDIRQALRMLVAGGDLYSHEDGPAIRYTVGPNAGEPLSLTGTDGPATDDFGGLF